MTEDNRKPVAGWTPQQYGGYSRGNTDVDFDGEVIEVCESVSGYEGYTSRTYISLELLNALLAEKHMCVVDLEQKYQSDQVDLAASAELEAKVALEKAEKRIKDLEGELEVAWEEDPIGKAERRILDFVAKAQIGVDPDSEPCFDDCVEEERICYAELDRRKLINAW